jgi:hypothetical protein
MNSRYIVMCLGILVLIVAASGCVANSKVNLNNTNYSGDGVSFNSPDNWNVSKTVDSDGNINIYIYKTNEKAQINIVDYLLNYFIQRNYNTQITVAISPNPKDMSYQEIVDAIKNPTNQGGNYQLISNSTLTVDGNTAYENIYIVNDSSRFTGLVKEKEINFIKNGNTYALLFDAPQQTYDQEEANFNTTLNSFKVR